MSQITIGGTTLNFKDSAFTGDQWEQVASWVLNGGAEGIDANAQIATEKAAAASASAAAARNSATSAGESAAAAASSATAAASSATAAKASEDATAGSATNAAASATSAGKSASEASERASDAANSASAAATSAQTAQSAAGAAADAASVASAAAEAASGSASQARESAAAAAESAASVDGINKTAQSWAVGGTGTREGEDTNNAKYWAEHAQQAAGGGVVSFNGRTGSVVPQAGDYGKGMVGLGNVDNTSDADKPVSTKQQEALNNKQAKITASGILRGDGSGGVTAAAAGTDYATPDSLPKPSDTAPVMDGTAEAGTLTTYARGDHKHPADTSKQAKITASGLLKGDGKGGVSSAVKGTDYAGPSVGVPVTLTAAGWNADAKTQTVSVAGVTATANCIITAAPDSYIAYAEAGVRCTAQGAGTLTFACETVPTSDVTANVLILG